MKQTVELKFRTKRYGRQTETTFSVSFADWDQAVSAWLWPAIVQYEKDTLLDPPNLTEWDVLRHALPALAKVPSWKRFTSIAIPSIEVDDVRDLYMDIDHAFHELWGADRGALRSGSARAFLNRFLLELRPDGRLTRASGLFRPRGRANHTPRPLISDQVASNAEPPIGALPHAHPKELKELAKKRLRDDIEHISAACCAELDAYYKACNVIAEIRAQHIEPEAERALLAKANHWTQAKLLTDVEKELLTTIYLRMDHLPTAKFATPGYQCSDYLSEKLSERMGIKKDRFLRCARYPYYPHQRVLVAAIVLLQIATAWNVSSVMELPHTSIEHLGPDQYLIQSVKSKTGDETPPCLLEGSDNPGVRALRFAVDRLLSLKSRGWAAQDEVCLWLSPWSNHESMFGLPISNLAHGLVSLIERYSLPKFTFEQLRTQVLTLESVERGPIAAAELAGHSTLQSIGGYIEHLLTTRLNTSVNLEFQRRWDSEVAATAAGKHINHPLIPIGDGSSCKDPDTPPKQDWLDAGICDAKHCHSGHGCPNRTLLIDEDRIKEVRLTRKYYLQNWQRLLSSNPEQFASLHAPRIEFNFLLFAYLKNGPYRSLLND